MRKNISTASNANSHLVNYHEAMRSQVYVAHRRNFASPARKTLNIMSALRRVPIWML